MSRIRVFRRFLGYSDTGRGLVVEKSRKQLELSFYCETFYCTGGMIIPVCMFEKDCIRDGNQVFLPCLCNARECASLVSSDPSKLIEVNYSITAEREYTRKPDDADFICSQRIDRVFLFIFLEDMCNYA